MTQSIVLSPTVIHAALAIHVGREGPEGHAVRDRYFATAIGTVGVKQWADEFTGTSVGDAIAQATAAFQKHVARTLPLVTEPIIKISATWIE